MVPWTYGRIVWTFYIYIHVFVLFASLFSSFGGVPVGRTDARTTVNGRSCLFSASNKQKADEPNIRLRSHVEVGLTQTTLSQHYSNDPACQVLGQMGITLLNNVLEGEQPIGASEASKGSTLHTLLKLSLYCVVDGNSGLMWAEIISPLVT